MRKSVSSLIHSEHNSSSANLEHFERQSLKQGRPPKKLISKRVAIKKRTQRPVLKKARHSVFSTDSNCHLISIQESTQQGLSSSSISKQSMEAQKEELSSLGFNFGSKDINSNLEGQRFFELKEYLQSISEHMLQKELQYAPKTIADPINIQECNRSKLISWIFNLSVNFRFKLQTPFIAANIVDRAIGLVKVSLDKLPILGITALFMATKYEEILIPHIDNFVGLAPQTYKVTKESMLKLEGTLLNLLNFDLGYESPLLFIHQTDLITPLPQFVKDRAAVLAKSMIIGSQYRYKTSSKIAAESIRIAKQEYIDAESSPSFAKYGFCSSSTKARA